MNAEGRKEPIVYDKALEADSTYFMYLLSDIDRFYPLNASRTNPHCQRRIN